MIFEKVSQVYAWTSEQPNWVSALTHAAICAVVITIGLGLEFASYLIEPESPIPFISHSASAMAGAYTLRELDDARKAVGTEDEGQRLGEGYEDWIAAIVVCIGLGVFYGRLF